ncbi:MAG: hypothetical protein HYX32_04115 [Actinobacteria bacterium]|nr:hypothetical protein [Actinomycetota bacterium]
MSDTSQGPGWWQASDGKWYSPESHPSYQAPTAPQPAAPPPPAAPAPMAPPPQMAPPPVGGPGYAPPPAKKGGKGCLIALIVVLVLLFGGAAAAYVGLRWVGNQVDNGNAFGKTECDAISTQELNSTLGGKYEVIQLGGITNIAGAATDTRIIPDATSCLATQQATNGTGGQNVRIARYEGGDAATRFQTEKTKAKGTTEDRGGGLSVESSSYFNKDVQAGDEAFCTTSDLALSSGAFVRKGNVLIYVSMMGSDSLPSFDSTPSGQTPTVKFTGDDKNCELAQKVIEKIK